MGWHSGAGRRGELGLAALGPPAGRLHGPLPGTGRPAPPPGRYPGGWRVGRVPSRRSARSATAAAPARLVRPLADSPGPALECRAVPGVPFALLLGPLPAA